MLAWPTAAKTCSAGELTVSVSGRILKVRDGAGRTGALTLPADADLGSARFGVGRLDPESDAAAVLAGWRRKGDAGHAALVVLDRVDGRWRTLELGTWPGAPPEAFPGELDGDGAPELVLADRRFEGVFGPPDQALYPPQLLQIRAGQPVDVSASGRFVDLYRHEMEAARPICFLGADAACAAYAADAARAGRAAQAWALLGERAGGVDKALPARLGAFLVRTGYLERVPDPQTAQAGARGE
jgi:hypothetical protein